MRLVLLSAALLTAALGLDQGWWAPKPSPLVTVWASRGVFAVAVLLAWRFHRGRLATAALLLAATAELMTWPPAGADTVADTVLQLATLLLPLQLAALALQKEWRLLSSIGAAWAAALAGQGVAAIHLAGTETPRVDTFLASRWIEALPAMRLPQAGVIAFGLAALITALCWQRRRTPVEGGLLAALATGLVAFELASEPRLVLAAGGVIVVLAQIENAFALAFQDGLTGLPARRALEESFRHLGRRYAIAMVDIDRFKRLNDRYGHEVGDQVLRAVASRLNKVRGGTAYRYGGEEFTLLFPRRDARDVADHLEALRRSIADEPFVVRSPTRPKKKPAKSRAKNSTSRNLKVTASFGVADRTADRKTTEQVLKAADKALYRSKRAGRNRLTVA